MARKSKPAAASRKPSSVGRIPVAAPAQLAKAASGISGLDEVTGGGLPRGRPTLVCGGPGCGKSLFAMEFLVRGATHYGENGVFVSFEEPVADLEMNAASLGFDLPELVRQNKISLDHVYLERGEIEESGEYDLEALFIRLESAIDSVKAKRVVLDTIETLFSGLSNQAVLRSELRRLFHWLKDKGVTAVITGERGDGTLTRQGLEEYVSDCVILLDHRVEGQISTRRLRIVKYRGSLHGTNEYPFLIDSDGLSVVPLSSLGLEHGVSADRVSSGVAGLDAMLDGKGFFRGSSVLITGTPGTGKTTLAASFAADTCAKGGRCLHFAFEESKDQILRNMRSVGLDLARWEKAGRLRIVNTRPTNFGLEMHLATMHKIVREFAPTVVVVDPISNMIAAGSREEAHNMLLRLVDFLKSRQTTGLFTGLTHADVGHFDDSELGISSLMDTWLLLRDIEVGGERNRGLCVCKSRGMPHSNQIREYAITAKGVVLREPYLGVSGVLTGSARLAEETRAASAEATRQDDLASRESELQRKRKALLAQIETLRSDLEAEEVAAQRLRQRETVRSEQAGRDARTMARSRGGANSREGKEAEHEH